MGKPSGRKEDQLSYCRYSIGEMARFLGVHPQTLRYYDNQGLIKAPREKGNGYRTYSNYDIYRFTTRKLYKNLGFSLEESKDFFYHGDLKGVNDILDVSKQHVEKEKRMLRIRERGIEIMQGAVKRIPLYLNR